MNHCRRCESDYEKPGTCNCFAEGGDKKPADPWMPVKPAPTYSVCEADGAFCSTAVVP